MFKQTISIAIIAGALISMTSCDKLKSSSKTELKTSKDSLSYSFGVNIASSIKTQFGDTIVNVDLLISGLKDRLDSANTLDDAQAMTVIQNYFQEANRKKMELERKKSEGNIEIGKAFLEENKGKEGVKVTASGLQYIVLKEGKGPKPTLESKVTVHYHGTLIDGKVFDSSISREPATFTLGGVIKGWQEGLQLMTKGAKYKFFIPQELAYGDYSPNPNLPAYSTLIFEVELLDVK